MYPAVCASWMYCIQAPNCPLVHFDISNNPLGHTVPNAGDAKLAAQDVRSALGKNTSLRMLNISKSVFAPTELVAVFGGLCMNTSIKELHLGDLALDEPDCLQLAHAIDVCSSLNVIDIPNSKMGPKGAKLIIHQISVHARRIKYVDFSNANLGLLGIVPLAHVLAQHDCAIQTLKIQNNNILDEGGEYIAKQLAHNHVIKYLDVSNNHLGRDSGLAFGDLGRGIHKEGKKIAHSPIRSFYIQDNPDIGYQGSRYLADGFVVSHLEKINLSNIGAGPHMAYTLARAFRVATFTWLYCDISKDKLTRFGLNEICWSLRQNRKLRVVRMGDNDAGTDFCTNADQLGVHGIALPRVIRENVTLREVYLSHLGLNSEASVTLMEALTENYTIRKVNLSSNFMDDEVSYALSEMLRANDVIEDLNLSDNKMAYNVCFVLAECLESNHSLLTLNVGKNSLGAAGTATVEAFCFALNMNCRLRSLIMDTNRLGSEWGCLLADTFCRNNTLNRVSLLDNRFDKRAGQALYRAYAANGFLSELAVTRDEVGDDSFDQIARLMRKKKAIVTDADIAQDTGIELELSKVLYEYY